MKNENTRRLVIALTLMVLLFPVAAMGSAPGSPSPGGGSGDGLIAIATGSDSSVDGYLSLSPDDYGHWASVTYAGGGDVFNPAGAAGPLEAVYTSALFLFVPSRSQRIVLTENTNHLSIANDGSLTLSVTSPLIASDISGNSVNDSLESSFTAMGTNTDLSFDLTQTVLGAGPGVANVVQRYVITNNSSSPIDFNLARVYDGDFSWDGSFDNDQVGTTANGVGGVPYVFQHEASDPDATSVALSSPHASSYFGGKQGVLPAGGPPAYDFGTDTEVFDAFGVPTSWLNHIANVGYFTDGVSGTGTADAFMGLGFLVSLAPGESTTITINHTYGQAFPVVTSVIPTLGPTGLVIFAVFIAIFAVIMRRRRTAAQ